MDEIVSKEITKQNDGKQNDGYPDQLSEGALHDRYWILYSNAEMRFLTYRMGKKSIFPADLRVSTYVLGYNGISLARLLSNR